MIRILLVEDEKGIVSNLTEFLHVEGYEVDSVPGQRDALRLLEQGKFDLVLLDISLSDGNGFAVCKAIKENYKIPVIFLTASDAETSIIMGLDIGGDDYITKPFKLAVLMSRIHALLRRSQHFRQTPEELCSNGITLQLLEGRAYKDGGPIELTATEYKLLRFFMEHPGIILSPEQIMGRLWDCDGDFTDGNTLAVYIRRLRAKIEDDPARPARVITVRRMGYKWNTGGRTQ